MLREVDLKTVGTPDSEVERGWASGPFTEEEMTKRMGPLWLPARRFGIEQGDKYVRLMTSVSASTMLVSP